MKTEKWNGHEIRFVEKEPGDWWGIAVDVVTALSLGQTTNTIKRLDEKDKALITIKGLNRGNEPVNIISEFGIYKLIMTSRKPEARDFERWVFGMLKKLRESTGLEGFQVFRMMDKEHQKQAMARLHENLPDVVKSDYMKANEIANRVTSMEHDSHTLNKKDMPPAWLPFRQKVLDETIELMTANKKFKLRLPVISVMLKRFGFR